MASLRGLTETTIDIPLGGSKDQGGGLNQGVDNLLVQPPYLAELVNGDLLIDGSVKRRYPANELPDDGISTRAHQNMNSVFNHDGTALVVNTNLGPHVYTPGTGWSDTGEFGQPPCRVQDQRAVPVKTWYADSAVSDGYIAYVTCEVAGAAMQTYFTAYEYGTGALACPKTLVTGLPVGDVGFNPKIIAHPTTGLFHVAFMSHNDNATTLRLNCYSAANFPAATIVNTASYTGGTDQYELALGAAGYFYVVSAMAAHTLEARLVDEATYVTAGSQTVAGVGGSDGLGAWYNATATRLYVAAFDRTIDATAAKTVHFLGDLSTQTAGSDFTLLPSVYADVGYAGFVASFAYSGNSDGQMLMVLSTICYYDVPGLSAGPPAYQAEGALGQHGCTQAFVVSTTLSSVSTLKPAWNYYLSTRLWNPSASNAARPLFGLLRLNTAAHQSSGGATADTFFYEQWQSLQTTMLVCSYGVHAVADPEAYLRNLSVVARCHDNAAANPQAYQIDVSAYPFTSTPLYHSRLAGVSVVVAGGVSFARATYTSFSVRDVEQPPSSLYDHVFQGLQGTYGQLTQTAFEWTCAPCSKDSAQRLSVVSAGYEGYFDGMGSFENTPHSYPEVVDRPFQLAEPTDVDVQIPFYFEATDITGGVVDTDYAATNNLNVVFVWAWVDAYGNLHRSAPSSRHNSNGMRGITRTNGVYTIDMYVTDLPLSAIPATAEQRYLEVYVSGDVSVDPTMRLAVTLPYEPWSAGATPRDTERPWLLHVVPTLNELDIDGMSPYASAQMLYTEGDVLESLPPPAFLDTVATKDRLWGINAGSLYFTKPLEAGVAPEFNDNLSIPVFTGSGPNVALSVIDEKVIVFKQGSIFVVTGDGPNATGGGNAFPVPQSVSTDVGCVSTASVVRGPFGVVFQGLDGIYLLDRGLNLSWIGKPVINDITLGMRLTGVLVPQQSHVRWILNDTGRMVVWNYEQNQWSIYEGLTEKHGVPYSTGWVGLLDGVELTDESICYFTQERPTAPDEVSNYVEATMPLSFTTAWLKTAGIQGFVRVKRALLLGTVGTFPSFFDANNGLEVVVQYNYRDDTSSTYTWTDVDSTDRPQHEMHLQYQKCESLRFLVREVPAAGALTCPGASFSGISLRVGTKGVPFKYFPQSQVR
jgi:hypothetical protein